VPADYPCQLNFLAASVSPKTLLSRADKLNAISYQKFGCGNDFLADHEPFCLKRRDFCLKLTHLAEALSTSKL
jgi:hypothetical protein